MSVSAWIGASCLNSKMLFARFFCSGSRVGCEVSRGVQGARLPLQWLAIS